MTDEPAAVTTIEVLRGLWDHVYWADARIQGALENGRPEIQQAIREYAHIVGSEETWLARIEGRASRLPVWPDVRLDRLKPLAQNTLADYRRLLGTLEQVDLSRQVAYVNSAGLAFENAVLDILLHVALHGQYHRGKVNLLLRQSGAEPVPTDYIAFVRGVAAATERDQRR